MKLQVRLSQHLNLKLIYTVFLLTSLLALFTAVAARQLAGRFLHDQLTIEQHNLLSSFAAYHSPEAGQGTQESWQALLAWAGNPQRLTAAKGRGHLFFFINPDGSVLPPSEAGSGSNISKPPTTGEREQPDLAPLLEHYLHSGQWTAEDASPVTTTILDDGTTQYQASVRPLASSGWRAAVVTPYTQVAASAWKATGLALLWLVSLIGLLLVVFLTFLKRAILAPIDQLQNLLGRPPAGSPEHLALQAGNQISALAGSIQAMQKSLTEKVHQARERERDYRQLIESVRSIILRWDRNGLITFINTFGLQLFGYSEQELLGRHILDTIVPRTTVNGQEQESMITDILRHPDQYRLNENENRCKDGRTLTIQWTNQVILDQDGAFKEILSVGADITEMRQTQSSLLDSEYHYRTLFDTASDAILLLADGRCVDCNSMALTFFACSRPELLGRTMTDFSPPRQPDGGDSQQVLEEKMQAVLTGLPQRFSWQHRSRDNREYNTEVSLSYLEFNGQPHIQAVLRDVSERITLEGELRQAQKMEAIGTLAGGIAHDFNNILGAIIGNTQLAQLGLAADSSAGEYLTQTMRAAERAKGLVQQILTFSRKGEQDKQPLLLAPVIKEALKLLRASIPSTIAINQHITSRATIMGDPTQIHQVVMNLCTNAYHAMEEKGGELTVSLEDQAINAQAGNGHARYVLLTIRDTGIGIRREVLDKIYEPYFTTKVAGKGTGLGLAVVHGIIKSHQGRISVESQPGVGTVFSIALPVIRQSETVAGNKEQPIRYSSRSERILFVDDEEQLRRIGRSMLEAAGYHPQTCANGLEAMRLLRAAPESFDLLLTDMTMPGMTGMELINQARALRPDLPVILCSGYSDRIGSEQTRANGIGPILSKPFNMHELLGLVEKKLAR